MTGTHALGRSGGVICAASRPGLCACRARFSIALQHPWPAWSVRQKSKETTYEHWFCGSWAGRLSVSLASKALTFRNSSSSSRSARLASFVRAASACAKPSKNSSSSGSKGAFFPAKQVHHSDHPMVITSTCTLCKCNVQKKEKETVQHIGIMAAAVDT